MWWLIALGACRPETAPGDTQQIDSAQPTPTPDLVITAPRDGDLFSEDAVEVEVEVVDFRFEPPLEGSQGSLRLPLPLQWIPTAKAHGDLNDPSGYLRCTLDGGALDPMWTNVFVLGGLSEGEHTLEISLYWSDGDELYPPVEDEVTFTVDL